jgi:hypothetical protein
MKSLKYITIYLASLFPIYILYLILTHGVNIPFWDEWDLYPIIRGFNEGTLSVSNFFALHNEHRLVITRAIYLLNDILFNSNRLVILLF